ncbi:MAG TPA: hypothetical protein VHG51_14300, partial [Longimicrobiaceae bacterium]|nr:hypothetical protein [Longimicrobiaceae bacterium]
VPHPTAPVSELAKLRGVGPATASAAVAAAAPETYPFFDEQVAAQLPGLGPVAWTLGYYARYADALRAAARELGAEWTPALLERALWAHVGGKAGAAARAMTDRDLFLGIWELVPELSLYDSGPVPACCTYEIGSRDGLVEVRVRWRMRADGPEQVTAFAAPGDGTPRELPQSGSQGPDAFSITRVDERTLNSAALRGGEVLAHARRVASLDGTLLAIVQEGARPEGGRFRNFQVYRRAPAAP